MMIKSKLNNNHINFKVLLLSKSDKNPFVPNNNFDYDNHKNVWINSFNYKLLVCKIGFISDSDNQILEFI